MTIKPQKILILAANPQQTVRLRLDEELRDIKEGLQRSLNRDKFDLRYDLAVRPRDIRRAILGYRPNIIHFSGHGSGIEGLRFEDETGSEQLVTGEALAGLFGLFSKQVECVLLNACYSEIQAEAIVQHINYVIGMSDQIQDKAAIEFVVGFYDALLAYNPESDGDSPIEFAFDFARNAILLAGVSGESIPVIKKKAIIATRINSPVVEQRSYIQIPGRTKIYICQRLTQDWQDLADYFDIKAHERAGFKPGREPHSIWEWLEQRNRLGDLESALIAIGRDDLAEELKKKLVDDVEPEAAYLGKLDGNVPNLPPNFLPRPEQLEPLKKQLLERTNQPVGITGKSHRVGVQGMGGIGKTVLATALARDEEVRRAFPDGVFWVTLGQENPQILTWQSYLAKELGDKQATFTEMGLAKARLRELFADKACLLILDDIWRLENATPFDVLGERCQMLVTTRNAAIVTGLGGEEYPLGVLDTQQALVLLADWAKQPEIIGSTPQNNVALQIARECGYLPLALAMVGAMMRGKPLNRWQNILEKLRGADLEKIKQQFPDYPYPDLLKAIAVSIEALDENCKQRYLDFAVFREDTSIPEAVLQTFWQPLGFDEFDSQDIIDELVSKSLALRDEAGNLRLHDLQFDYVRKQHTVSGKESEGIGFLHNRLLNAYGEKYPLGWHDLQNDGYIWQNLAYHLQAGGSPRELQQLLFDFRWLQGKLENTNVNALIADYDFLPEDQNLQLIQGALRLSAHILNQDQQQLPGQLLGRLLGFEREEIQRLLTQVQQCTTPSLLPQTASFAPPGGSLVRTLVGHSASVNAVALAPDGNYVISASLDSILKVWNWQTGEQLRTLVGHIHWVNAVALTPDGNYVISASGDKTLKVWNWQTGELLRTLVGHSASVNAVALTPDGNYVISASHDSTLKVWNWQTGEQLRTLVDHSGWVGTLALTLDGNYVISASGDKTLKVWDWQTGELLHTLVGHSDSVKAVALTPDGNYMISASHDKTLKVWDWQTGELLRTLVGHSASVNAVTLTPDGNYVISASHDSTLKVWNWQTGELLRTLDVHSHLVNAVALTPDSNYIISASGDNTLKVWNWQTGELLPSFNGHSHSVKAVALTPDGNYMISASHDTTLKVWNWQTGELLRTLVDHSDSVSALALTLDGNYMISASYDSTLKVWNWQTGELLRTLVGHSGWVGTLALTLDGNYVISASGDSTLKVWNWQTGELLRTLVGHSDSVNALALTPDGNYVIFASYGSTLKVWSWQTGEVIASFIGDGSICCCAVAPDGVSVIAGDGSGAVHFLRLQGI
ncbi:NB-ARC domain-containing protein [Aetokthonos hydrillicola]|uniref:NB-ARC domain-containing protein n=1 Tax=Aetokthonos hydrillicola TaxID=1550245 RepID=UPI001ABA8AD6